LRNSSRNGFESYALSACSLAAAFGAATARAQTVMEWMTLSVAAGRTLSPASSSTAQSQCEGYGWLDLTLGQQLFTPAGGCAALLDHLPQPARGLIGYTLDQSE
jgi:hypothetical protein